MNIIISTTSMTPIYEQIVESVKHQILSGELVQGEALPSVRALSRELKISALTAKKAYDCLEDEGLITTVHGKGSFVHAPNLLLVQEAQRRDLEQDLEALVEKAKRYGVSGDELRAMLDIITEE